MPKQLPYRTTTAGGNQFEFEFPLHPETGSAVHVTNLLDAVLGAVDREVRQHGSVSNGDVLQALAMTLAVRTRVLPGDPGALAGLARQLLEGALSAPAVAGAGNVSPEEPRELH